MATSNPVDISAVYERLRKDAEKFNRNARVSESSVMLFDAKLHKAVTETARNCQMVDQFFGVQHDAESKGIVQMTILKPRTVVENEKLVKVTFQSGGDVFDEENRFDLGGDITPPPSALKRVMVQYDCSIEDAQCYLDLREEGHSQYVAAVNAGLIDPAS